MLTEHGWKIAPNTYWVTKKRPPSRRLIRDDELRLEIARVDRRSRSRNTLSVGHEGHGTRSRSSLPTK